MRVMTQAITWPYYRGINICSVAKNKIQHARSCLTLENAKELIRRTFLLIGKMFAGLGVAAGIPFFAVDFLINKCAGYGAKYKVGSEKYALSEVALHHALCRLKTPARSVEKLEFVCPTGSELHFNEASVQSLQEILPGEMLSRSFQIPQNILDALETHTHYYRYNETLRTYELRRKIFHLVLPPNRNEALRSIDSLVERGERVVNVYFFPSTGTVDVLRNALIPLAPQVAMQVESPPGSSIDTLMPLITLSDSQ